MLLHSPNCGADLANNSIGPIQLDYAESIQRPAQPFSGGFTYHSVHYTGDQAAIAQGDNFLSIIVPQIMASQAYQNNGVIIIWWDETEGGDTTNERSREIVISPLAKGNAYASSVEMSHSSDIKTWRKFSD